MTNTVGFEAEFASTPEPLIRPLRDLDLTRAHDMCGWHCREACCQFGEGGYPFRFQTDSSCGGEVISNIMQMTDDHLTSEHDRWITHLSDLAFDHDIEPGLTAGFHVHVGNRHMDRADKARSVLAFAAWEPYLLALAGGRWRSNRDFNGKVRNWFGSYLAEQLCLEDCSRPDEPYGYTYANAIITAARCRNQDSGDGHAWLSGLYDLLAESGLNRHANLNIFTGRNTFEYRLWNSTRAAWRMRLWCGLTVALVDPVVVGAMLDPENVPPFTHDPARQFAAVRRLAKIVRAAGYENTAALLRRQNTYWQGRAEAEGSLPFTAIG